jgi:site-specific recombinase XerD
MDQSKRPASGHLPLCQLVTNALGDLERLGYSRRTLNRYRGIWTDLVDFSRQEMMGDELLENVVARFIEEYRVGKGEICKEDKQWRQHVAFCLRVLTDFSHEGSIPNRFRHSPTVTLRPRLEKVLRDYEQYSKDRLQLRPSTLRKRITELRIFLNFLDSSKERTLDQLQAVDLTDFLSSRLHLSPFTVSRILCDLRSFLRFLAMREIIRKDLSSDLPRVRVPRDARIPSVWEPELIVKLLAVIDRSSAKGKRDYAILLLACRLGLRAGDIRKLTLDQLNWDHSTIEITQSKTAMPIILPLTQEIGEALIDYLRTGRPKTTHREVFLKLRYPFEPFVGNLYDIVAYWRELAGIKFRSPQKQGLHSLRHSLATRLLAAGTPLQTISEILGHTTLESTRIYAKVEMKALRSVALDPEEVSHVE